ncbi:MAG: starch-binding protein, partial [Clostridia bacterium]|nr:starch-binding protein [Clostridia bacterium]
KVVEEHEHVASETYSSDATGHWYACTTCSAVIEGTQGDHDTNGTDGACSVCGWVTPVEEEKVTVFFYNHQGWTTVHAYAWTNVEDSETVLHLGAWPGTEISAVDGEEGWYSVEVSADAQKIIFNDGSAQTADLEIKEGLVYFYNVAGYASKELAIAQYEADVKADEEAKKESRIYLDVTALTWFGSSNAVIKAYVWYTDDTNNTWPGVEMEIIDEMYSIKYDDTKTIQGIIFLRLSPDGTEWNRIELQEVSFNIETPVYVVSSNGGAIGSGTWSTLAE